MVISEESRHELFTALEGAVGRPATATLMAHLPPVGWADVATKSDLRTEIALLRSDLRAEMALLRSELRTEMAELRAELKGEMAEFRTELKGEMAELRTELKGDIASLEVTMHREFSALRRELSATVRTFVLGTVGSMFTAVGLAFTAGHFTR